MFLISKKVRSNNFVNFFIQAVAYFRTIWYHIIRRKDKNVTFLGDVIMYEAIYNYKDIANYVIAYCNNNQRNITNLVLQKIMYYIQGYFTKEFQGLAFDSEIIHWPYGPVVLDAYYDFCIYGYKAIDSLQTPEEIENSLNKIGDCEHRKLINSIIDKCLGKSITSLIDGTHQENPWKTTINKSIISESKIIEYFHNNNPLEIN